MVIRQIIFNEQTGRLILSDSDNNHYLCDIYGNKMKEFLPKITGTASAAQRKELGEFKFDFQNVAASKSVNYMPSIRKFEGYSKFPRPLVPPFSNIPSFVIKSTAKQTLIKTLTKYFSHDKVLHLLKLNNSNNGLAYLTYDLNPCDNSKEDSKRLLKLIEDHFQEYRMRNKYQLNIMPKDPIIKALKKFKQVLLENEDMTIINGRKLNSPPQSMSETFKANSTIINKVGIKKDITSKSQSTANVTVEYQTTKAYNSNKHEEDHEMSCISNETENEVKYFNANVLKVKSVNLFNKSLEQEKRLIDGFPERIIKEEPIIRKCRIRNYKSTGDFYLEDMARLKKGKDNVINPVNPIAFKQRDDKEMYDLKELEKKRSQKYIFQKNMGFNIEKKF